MSDSTISGDSRNHQKLTHLITEARALAGENLCYTGHLWTGEGTGGRACPRGGNGSQPVYICQRCGEYDYGYPGGPGYDACKSGECGCHD